jgi:hypothetical protein
VRQLDSGHVRDAPLAESRARHDPRVVGFHDRREIGVRENGGGMHLPQPVMAAYVMKSAAGRPAVHGREWGVPVAPSAVRH